MRHDTDNVTDSGCHCISADHSSRRTRVRVVGSVASSSELLLGPVFETKQRHQNREMGSAVASLICAG